MFDLTGHMIIWGELFAHGDGSTGLMKVVFCFALPTVVQGFGANESFHFRTTTFWVQCFWGWGCNCLGLCHLSGMVKLIKPANYYITYWYLTRACIENYILIQMSILVMMSIKRFIIYYQLSSFVHNIAVLTSPTASNQIFDMHTIVDMFCSKWAFHRVLRTGASSRTGTAYHSGNPEVTLCF
jgi:hypothetical protein